MDLFPPQFPKVIDGLLYLIFIPRAARADEMTGRKKLPVVFPRRQIRHGIGAADEVEFIIIAKLALEDTDGIHRIGRALAVTLNG